MQLFKFCRKRDLAVYQIRFLNFPVGTISDFKLYLLGFLKSDSLTIWKILKKLIKRKLR